MSFTELKKLRTTSWNQASLFCRLVQKAELYFIHNFNLVHQSMVAKCFYQNQPKGNDKELILVSKKVKLWWIYKKACHVILKKKVKWYIYQIPTSDFLNLTDISLVEATCATNSRAVQWLLRRAIWNCKLSQFNCLHVLGANLGLDSCPWRCYCVLEVPYWAHK